MAAPSRWMKVEDGEMSMLFCFYKSMIRKMMKNGPASGRVKILREQRGKGNKKRPALDN